jgi:hypothetical protein
MTFVPVLFSFSLAFMPTLPPPRHAPYPGKYLTVADAVTANLSVLLRCACGWRAVFTAAEVFASVGARHPLHAPHMPCPRCRTKDESEVTPLRQDQVGEIRSGNRKDRDDGPFLPANAVPKHDSQTLTIHCGDQVRCSHQVTYTRAQALARFGPDMMADELRRRVRCTRCGRRGAVLIIAYVLPRLTQQGPGAAG